MTTKGYFVHQRFGAQAKGGVTVYFEITHQEPDIYHVCYTVAACSLCDNFNRRIGRNISKGRFNKGKHLDFYFHANSWGEAKEQAMEKIQNICDLELENIMDRYHNALNSMVRRYRDRLVDGGLQV